MSYPSVGGGDRVQVPSKERSGKRPTLPPADRGGIRLPASTPHQRRTEAARQFHEEVWVASCEGYAVHVPAVEDDATTVLNRVNERYHKFWSSRGYRLRVAIVQPHRQAVRVWVERR